MSDFNEAVLEGQNAQKQRYGRALHCEFRTMGSHTSKSKEVS